MYRAKVGDVVEYQDYVGIIHFVDANTTKLDWIGTIHPNYDYRASHADADWYPVVELEQTFQLLFNVHDFSIDTIPEKCDDSARM